MPDLYTHPSITSFITDETQLFPYAQGLTQLFAPVFAEKGADNVLATVDSANEYIDKYGDPNSVLYGQAPLQTVEWVKAGGQAAVMRLLPEDACFAHAVIDFQTKSNEDTVVQSWEYVFVTTLGEELHIPIIRKEDPTRPGTFIFEAAAIPTKGFAGQVFRTNVRTGITAEAQLLAASLTTGSVSGYSDIVPQSITLIRPQVKRAPAGVSTRDGLAAWARALHGNGDVSTADGYKHNVYGFFLPKGRGSRYYNNLEFKVSGTDQYDDTYSFRVYTLEIYERLTSGELKHVVGPFLVSFDPNALARDNESMFVGDVLAKYSNNELTFELLSSADITDLTDESEPSWLGFETVGEALSGGLVDPALLDPFFLQERSLSSGGTQYHRTHVLTGGATALTVHAHAGDESIYVENPSIFWPGCEVSINGRESFTLGTTSEVIDIVTGKLIVPALIEDLAAGAVIVVGTPAEMTIASAMIKTGASPYDDSTILIFNDSAKTLGVNNGVPEPSDEISKARLFTNGEPRFAMERIGVNSGAAVLTVYNTNATIASQTQIILEEMSVLEDDIQFISFRTADGSTFTQPNVSNDAGKTMVLSQYNTYDIDGSFTMDFDTNVKLKKGTDGRIDPSLGLIDPNTNLPYNSIKEKNILLIKAYTGIINDDVMLKRWWPFDVILDANYPLEVKTAMNQMAAVMRGDLVYIADLGFTANPAQAIERRDTLAQFSDIYTAIYAQDYVIFDTFAGKRVRVTTPYFCAQKMPYVDRNFGIHWPFVGPRRGVISGFQQMSWNPNDAWQERLYKRQINYTKRDPKRTMLFGQLTSQTVVSALSDLSHVRALLRIQRDVEIMMEDYQFEFINANTLTAANSALNAYLNMWIENGCCTDIKGTVYSSPYDKRQKLGRVRIEIYFTSILERIVINLVVKG